LVPAVATAQPGDTAGGAPPPDAPATSSAYDRGWLLEVRYQQADRIEIRDSFGGIIPAPEPQGALFAGYQHRRWSFVLGLELARRNWDPDENTGAVGLSETTFFLVPGVRVALGRSTDGRAEAIAIFDLALGESSFVSDNDVESDDISIDRLKLQVGPGVRYWFGSSFALGASALIRHSRAQRVIEDQFSGVDSVSDSSTTDLATSISILGLF
jgi:hypothetical protein